MFAWLSVCRISQKSTPQAVQYTITRDRPAAAKAKNILPTNFLVLKVINKGLNMFCGQTQPTMPANLIRIGWKSALLFSPNKNTYIVSVLHWTPSTQLLSSYQTRCNRRPLLCAQHFSSLQVACDLTKFTYKRTKVTKFINHFSE